MDSTWNGATIPAPVAAIDDVVGRVISNEWVNAEYKLLVAEVPPTAAAARAGQFFNLKCPSTGTDRPFFRRPMSTYRADPAQGRVEFLYKVTGAGTRGLASLVAEDALEMLGPLGNGFELDPSWGNIVVVGRGVGLATLAPLAELAAERGIGVTALISARGPEQLLSIERFAAAGAHVEIVLDSRGDSGMDNVESIIRTHWGVGLADAFFTCGSNRLLQLLQRLGDELGVPGQVALEQQMACGLGMCFCCVRNFKVDGESVSRRVCWDGPVFALSEAI